MKRLMIVTLGAALIATACGTKAADATDALTTDATAGAVAPVHRAITATPEKAAAVPVPAAYRDVTIPAGTTFALSLTSAVASDTSVVEDKVTATLTQGITLGGREVVAPGARFTGTVTGVDASGRVKGRAMVAFRFTSLNTGHDAYDVQTTPVTQIAEATKGEDATKIGIGAGAGAVLGGILGGKGGAAKGAAAGAGAGTGVVLATKGKEVRLTPGTDVTTQLSAPLTVRVPTR